MTPRCVGAELDPRRILNSIGEVVYDWDMSSDRLVWGPNICDVPGLTDLVSVDRGRAYAEHLAPESQSSRYEAVMSTAGGDNGDGVPYQVTYGLCGLSPSDGGRPEKPVWVEDTGRWFAAANGRPGRAHGIIRVITERHEVERARALHLQFDAMTGALNRTRFVELIGAMLAGTGRKKSSFGILLVSLENLAAFNRSHGFGVGDELIAGMASRLKAHMRGSDHLGRYAGNKFAMLLQGCDTDQMEIAARRFVASIIEAPLDTSAGAIAVSIRVGGVLAPRQGRTSQSLLQNVEEALHAARQAGSQPYVAYRSSLSLHDERRQASQIADEVVAALNQSRIVLAAQPIVATATGKTAFYEGLMRLRREDGELTLPDAILPIAAKSGLVPLIDQRMLDLAVAALAADPDLQLTINAAGTTVLDIDWPARLEAACALHQGVATRLIVEITETCAIADIEGTRRAIAAMKACGVRVAMDDFGAGHTSFRNLRNLKVDLLKIDGAFVQNLARSADDRFFVRTLVDLARHLEVATVAEWVEDHESAAILADWGVDYLQGHLFGKAELLGGASSDTPHERVSA